MKRRSCPFSSPPLCLQHDQERGQAWHSGHRLWLPGGRNGGVSLSLPLLGSWNVSVPSLGVVEVALLAPCACSEGRGAVYPEDSAHSTRLRNGLMFLVFSLELRIRSPITGFHLGPRGTGGWPPGTSRKACPRPWQRGDIEGWLGVVFQC